MVKINLEMNEKHAQIIKEALDFYARIGMGQLHELNYHPAFQTRDYDMQVADEQIAQLKSLVFKDLYGKGHSYGIRNEKTNESCKEAYDIFQVINHNLAKNQEQNRDKWSVVYAEPIQYSEQPLIKCKIEK